VFYLPCPLEGLPTPNTDPERGSYEPPKESPVTLDITGNLFVAKVKHGAALWTGALAGEAHVGDTTTPIVFAPENVSIDMRVSTDISKAIEAYERPWLAKHMRWQCPGVGVFYDGKLSAGLSCTYGLTW